MQVHHRCRNRACVNPEHLDVLTPAEHKLLHQVENRLNHLALQAAAGDTFMLMEADPHKRAAASRATIRWALT
jgi:hypothetical protein